MLSVYTHCYLIDIKLYIHIMQQKNSTKEITEWIEMDITFHLHNMNIRHMNFLSKSQVGYEMELRHFRHCTTKFKSLIISLV
jgi:hypothetical protein